MRRPTLPRSTKSLVLAVVLVIGTAACQSLVETIPLDQQLAPLYLALSQSPEVLRARAEAGEAEAQLALSLVYTLERRHAPDAVSAAAMWRGRALAQRRFTPITQYTAAFNGQPSRVNIINVPVPVITTAQAAAIDACVEALMTDEGRQTEACGTNDAADERFANWGRAKEAAR